MEKISVTTGNKNTFLATIYKPQNDPIAVVQILHGMAEHQGRYKEFINFLISNDIAVFIHDHLGHGDRIKVESDKGYFGGHKGWDSVIEDAKSVSLISKQRFPNIPFILLGHSMGSFVAFSLIESLDIYDSCILSAPSKPSTLLLFLQRFLLKSEVKKIGMQGYSQKIDDLVFGGFNKQIKDPKTPHDWLSHNEVSVNDYLNDPLCGFKVTNALWLDLADAIKTIYAKAALNSIPNNLSILIMAGSNDPVGNNGKGPRNILKLLRQVNKNVNLKMFENMRHEVLNETNNSIVYDEVFTYIMKNHGTAR